MNPQEQEIYWRVFTAAVQGIHANGKVYDRSSGAADYHPSTSYWAAEQPRMVNIAASKQAHAAVEHCRALKDSFTI